MKTLLLSFFLLMSNLMISQSIKVLFDASKAESAGNADWVIDADSHNIGYGNGPAAIGSGNESNPQRFPTPAQSGITNSTSESYWKGSLSAWGIDCVKQGYQVETLPYNVPITYGTSNVQDLSNYNVFVVDEPNIRFTTAEKTALMNFVQNGGGLFMVSDHCVSDRNNDGWDSPQIWNDFMKYNSVQTNPFGITFDSANFSETSANIPTLPNDSLLHGPMGNAAEVMWTNGTSMTLYPSLNNTVKGIVYKTGSAHGNTGVMAAYARYGNGKVTAIGDSSPTDDGTGDSNDVLYNGWTNDANGNHERLIMNATIWLAASSPLTTGIESSININSTIHIYPNPLTTSATIEIETAKKIDNATFKIIDILGNEVKTIENINSNKFIFEKEELKSGIYFFNCSDKKKIIGQGKFIIN